MNRDFLYRSIARTRRSLLRRVCVALSAMGVVAMVSGCGGDEFEIEMQRYAITKGTPVPAGKDLAVVGLLLRDPEDPQNPFLTCTGTLITPHMVLTAGHCLNPLSGSPQAEPMVGKLPTGLMSVMFGGGLDDPEGFEISVVETLRHPKYDPETYANDLSLLKLAFSAPPGVPPIPLPALRLELSLTDKSEFIGKTFRIVGFGEGLETDTVLAGRKHEATTRVGDYDDKSFQFGPEFYPEASQTCRGDSGGPAFYAPVDQSEQLIGVTSKGTKDCNQRAVNMRVDYYVRDFIEPGIESLQGSGSQQGPFSGDINGPPEVVGVSCRLAARGTSNELGWLLGCLMLGHLAVIRRRHRRY